MRVLRGRPVADEVSQRTAALVARLAEGGVRPTLAVLDATGDPAAARFARAKEKACGRLGMAWRYEAFPPRGAADRFLQRIRELSADPGIHGLLLEGPLSREYQERGPHERIPPEKDVEGLHPSNLGRLFAGSPLFVPATAAACLEILDHYQVMLPGRRAVVVGRSSVVGRPVALLLLARHATVTICHSRTRDLAAHTREAEVLVVAAGCPGLVQAPMVRPGAVVVDVGTNVTEAGEMVGDVDPSAEEVAGALTPVPGGVGPVTTALLLWQTAEACRLQVEATSAPPPSAGGETRRSPRR